MLAEIAFWPSGENEHKKTKLYQTSSNAVNYVFILVTGEQHAHAVYKTFEYSCGNV